MLERFDVGQDIGLHGLFDLLMGLPLDHVGQLRTVRCVVGFSATSDQDFVVVWVGALWLVHISVVMLKQVTCSGRSLPSNAGVPDQVPERAARR
jgi:hypothetical protein